MAILISFSLARIKELLEHSPQMRHFNFFAPSATRELQRQVLLAVSNGNGNGGS